MSMNYLGLHSLRNRGFRQLIRSYFMSGDRVPDVMVLNSRLHDGCYWTSVRIYAQAADFAAQFWSGVMDKVRARGHAVPRVFYRTQMPQGGIDAGKNHATPFTELRDEAGVTYSHPQGWVTLQTLPNEVLVVLRKVIRYWKNFLAVPNLEHSRNLLANKRETFLNRNYD
ncbi:hypothetical protein ZEAMMB73_Zm00001d019724 [Zea mays]|uniref:Uncharacterized protein n=1 Tax=Zea mays TaxID=4577 RepID=A0A1D6HZY9_MAIZE|nr:hypothetical protein ZEAMMB73_Zm00001d019724 [Zea mays]